MKCLTCKKHYTQQGKCYEEKENCLFYEEEPRGKKIRTTFSFKMNHNAQNPVIKYGSKIIFQDGSGEFEATIIKINEVNMNTGYCNVDADYYENEMPRFEKRRMFKILQ